MEPAKQKSHIPYRLFDLVNREIEQGRDKYGPFKSKSEAWAICQSELMDWFWYLKREEIEGQGNTTMEAVQVAAVALRYLIQFWDWPPVSSSPAGSG